MAQFEFELEKPNEIFPTGPAGFRQGQPQGEPRRHPRHQPGSSHAPGHPGATGGRRSRPRRRGPKAIERSKMRAAAHQASLAAARCAATATALPPPPPPPPPPPTGPATTRSIKVVTRRASFRSSFSQLDGQDSSVDESDCPTTPKEKQWEQNVTMVDEHSRMDAAANIVCCSGKVAEEEEPLTATSASLELTPPPKPQPPPLNYVRRARERRALKEREANAPGDEMNGRDRDARLEERNQNGAEIRDDPPNDPGWMSHDYIPQTGPCMACLRREVGVNDWYSDSAAKFPFCKGCAKAAGYPKYPCI